ncbi:MAG: hypothetical protein AAFR83_25800, partial [Cyanobacteria bacterium J06629_18]
AEILYSRYEISQEREKKQQEKMKEIERFVTPELALKIQLANETGASSWLTSLPIKAKGFNLNKQEFCDALALRYGWSIEGLPSICPGCQQPFNEGHANQCMTGGYISMRHDEVRDLTHQMLHEVCREVEIEPNLQPCSDVTLSHNTANRQIGARVDLSARGFWTRGQRAFFDVRIFEPSAKCYFGKKLSEMYEKNEKDKIREYNERIVKVEQGVFTPLVFSAAGGMAPRTQIFYKRIAELMADKKGESKGFFSAWLRVRLSFALLRSALLCLRGTRTSRKKIVDLKNTDFESTIKLSNINIKY